MEYTVSNAQADFVNTVRGTSSNKTAHFSYLFRYLGVAL